MRCKSRPRHTQYKVFKLEAEAKQQSFRYLRFTFQSKLVYLGKTQRETFDYPYLCFYEGLDYKHIHCTPPPPLL